MGILKYLTKQQRGHTVLGQLTKGYQIFFLCNNTYMYLNILEVVIYV